MRFAVRALAVSAAVAAAVLGACGSEDNDGSPTSPRTQNESTDADRVRATTAQSCDIGGRPDYFVPGGDDGLLPIIGCARLGVSQKRVELSVDYEGITREEDYVCLNAAYNGRRQRGIYIPSICPPDPVSGKLEILSAQIPRQAVRGYELVILGTARASTRKVVARYGGEEVGGAVFTVKPGLAKKVGATTPFSAFIVELPVGVACEAIDTGLIVSSETGQDQIPVRSKLCELASKIGALDAEAGDG